MILLMALVARASPLDALGPIAPLGKAPNLTVNADGTVDTMTYLQFGLDRAFGLNVGLGFGAVPLSAGPFELLPRWFPIPAFGLGLHAIYAIGDDFVVLGPEIHTNVAAGPCVFYADFGWSPTVGGTTTAGDGFVNLSFEVFLDPRLALFVEMNRSPPPRSGQRPGIRALMNG